jgi:uncharacterized protein YecE (DUF72 family)
MKLHVGTSGYSYKEWKGIFYPERLPAKEMLHYYAERLPAVEINNTFYRLPKADMLEAWGEQVPSGFVFSLKASRRITHLKRLKDAADETDYLFRTSAVLGEKLGVILFQLPPYLKKDAARLEAFLTKLPEGARAAFEFRHPTWLDEETQALLRVRDCALCLAETDDGDRTEVISTAGWGYLRLRRESYTEADLLRWIESIRAQNWSHAFVFFKHEDEAAGPRMAQQFLQLARSTEDEGLE